MPSRVTRSAPIKVLIADDHPVVRNGIAAALSGRPDMEVVGKAGDGLEAEALAVQLEPDVVIMDIYMPVRGGLESMIHIKCSLPNVKVLFLTVSGQEDDVLSAIRLGADGYLLKSSDISDIVDAVTRVAAGDAVLCPSLTATVMHDLKQDRRLPALSAREQQVLEWVGQGLTNAEIAARLVVAQGTVATYVYRLLHKLHLKNRSEAIAYALRQSSRREPF